MSQETKKVQTSSMYGTNFASFDLKGRNFKMDRNGNHVVRFKLKGKVKTIQTNGNLPMTHRLTKGMKKASELHSSDLASVMSEITNYMATVCNVAMMFVNNPMIEKD